MRMRSIIAAAAASIVSAISCMPVTTTVYLDLRHPSESGIDLAGKSVSVVYEEGTCALDSVFSVNAASSFARALEKDYYGGEELIDVFMVPSRDSVDLDFMHSLVMDTEGDVVFLLERPQWGEADAAGSVPLKIKLYSYDSMGKEDTFASYNGSTVIKGITGPSLMDEPEEAVFHSDRIGQLMSRKFLSVWKTEGCSLYYYEIVTEDWETPLEYAYGMKWKEAVDSWIKLLESTKNTEHKACAAYNIATAFYVMGDFRLSQKWLDQSDSFDANLPLSAGLRKKIADRL